MDSKTKFQTLYLQSPKAMEQALKRHEKEVMLKDFDRVKLRDQMKTTIDTIKFEN